MKLTGVMVFICLALAATLLATFTIEERPSATSVDTEGRVSTAYLGHGQAHPEYSTLRVGGSGAERAESIFALATLYGALEIAFFLCCLLLGMRRHGVIGPAGRLVAAGGIVYLASFAALMFSYRRYMSGSALETFGALPLPTAWMLFAVALVPFAFLLIFVLGFRHYVWDDQSESALQQILADKRAAEAAVAAGAGDAGDAEGAGDAAERHD